MNDNNQQIVATENITVTSIIRDIHRLTESIENLHAASKALQSALDNVQSKKQELDRVMHDIGEET